MTGPALEDIPDEDVVSRHVDSPDKWRPEELAFVDDRLFMFQKPDEVESVVWRKYAPLLADVHHVGCLRQAVRRQQRPNWTYEGAISAVVSDIRCVRTPLGDAFEVVHEPEEGIYHAHIRCCLAQVQDRLRQRKSDLKERLRRMFGPLDPHGCG